MTKQWLKEKTKVEALNESLSMPDETDSDQVARLKSQIRQMQRTIQDYETQKAKTPPRSASPQSTQTGSGSLLPVEMLSEMQESQIGSLDDQIKCLKDQLTAERDSFTNAVNKLVDQDAQLKQEIERKEFFKSAAQTQAERLNTMEEELAASKLQETQSSERGTQLEEENAALQGQVEVLQ